MVSSNASTPGRATPRPGSFVFSLALLLLAGCDVVGRPATLELDGIAVQLERGARVHDVTVMSAGPTDSIAPATVQAAPGDAIRFVTGDHRTHSIGFDLEFVDPMVREYLERTSQLRGPPLVNRGSAWIVVLEGAPPGRYPFLCRTHGTRGILLVQDPD